MGNQASPTTYTSLPYELRNAVLLAAIDPGLIPLVQIPDYSTHVRIEFSKQNSYTSLILAIETFEALSQIPSLWLYDGLANAAKHHIHSVAEYYAAWKILHLNRTLRCTDARWPLEQDEYLRYQIYQTRFTRFAGKLAKNMRLNDVATFDRMIAEIKHWHFGLSEVKDCDPDSILFEELTWVYEQALREREEASAGNARKSA